MSYTGRRNATAPRPASFAAKFPGYCKACRKSFVVGTEISGHPQGGYRHATCPSAIVANAQAPRPADPYAKLVGQTWAQVEEGMEWFDGEDEIALTYLRAWMVRNPGLVTARDAQRESEIAERVYDLHRTFAGCETVEASDLGLPPGTWPAQIRRNARTYSRGSSQIDGDGDVTSTTYFAADRSQLIVLND